MAKKRKTVSRSFKSSAGVAQQQKFGVPFWAWLTAGGVAAVLAVIGLFYLGTQGTANTTREIEGLVVFGDPGAGHEFGDILYPEDTPPGGPHSATWQNCGIYDEPVPVEQVVHSLEHGAVWLAYQPELPDDQVEQLRDLVRRERDRRREPLIVLAPKPGLDSPIVATAWQVQLKLDNAGDERLAQFVERYQRGPFTPERGASCVGGDGEPS